MVHLIEVLDLRLVGIAGDDGIVKLNSGGIELGIQLSHGCVQLIDLSHQSLVGLSQLRDLGFRSGEGLLKGGSIGTNSVQLIGELSNSNVQGGNLVREGSIGLFELLNLSSEIIASDS